VPFVSSSSGHPVLEIRIGLNSPVREINLRSRALKLVVSRVLSLSLSLSLPRFSFIPRAGRSGAIYRALTGLEFNRRDLARIKDRLIFRAENQVCQHRRSFSPSRLAGDVVAGFRSGIAKRGRRSR